MTAKDTLDIMKTLIGFQTESGKPNLDIIDFIEGYLADFDVSSTIDTSDDGLQANLYCTIGPDDLPGIALAGHSDVVPVEGQDWTTDPWALTERDGNFFRARRLRHERVHCMRSGKGPSNAECPAADTDTSVYLL